MRKYNEFPGFIKGHFKPVDPFVPPVPSVLEGSSLYECMNKLSNRVNICISTYNSAIADCYSTLNKLYRAGQANGSYYTPEEVQTQYLYDVNSNCDYCLITKRVVDKRGEPIRTKLKFALDAYSDQNVNENIWEKSYSEISDKIFPAQNKNSIWNGNVFHNGVCLSKSNETGFTVGFSKNGDMHVYSNTIPLEQYKADEIVDSCGVNAYVIANKKNIASNDDKAVRTQMGYDNLSKTLYIITCNTEGMTQNEMSSILMQYGVWNAVELSTEAPLLSAGYPVYYSDLSTQNFNLFWSISRKDQYVNDMQYDVGELFQKYSKQMNNLETAQKKIDSLKNDLNQEIVNRIAGDNVLDVKIAEEEASRKQADIQTNQKINTEIAERTSEDAKLQDQINNINTEIDSINGIIESIENDITQINNELTATNNRISDITTGATRIPYLKATTSTSNTSAYDINMGNKNITSINENNLYTPNDVATQFNILTLSESELCTFKSNLPPNNKAICYVTCAGAIIVYSHWSGANDNISFNITNANIVKSIVKYKTIDTETILDSQIFDVTTTDDTPNILSVIATYTDNGDDTITVNMTVTGQGVGVDDGHKRIIFISFV